MPTHTSFLEIRRKFDQIFIKLKIWRKYYICLCRGAAVTTGFVYAQKLVDRAAVGFLVIYFSNSWEKNKLSNAVAMVNVLEGLSSILVLAMMTYMSENHVSPLKVILYSNAAYITGMVMLCISAFHPIPGDMSGMYFVPVVLLIAVGKAGGLPILEEFLVGQLAAHKPRELDRVNARKTVWWFTASLLCTLSTPLIFGNIAGWRATFMVSTSVMAIGCLLFWNFIPLYPRSVDKAATTSEISLASPEENTNNGPTPAVSTGRRQKEQWKPLSVMIPMWTTFLVFGLVLSTGDTLFTEQGNMMEGNEDPTVLIYVVDMIGTIVRATSSFFTAILLKYVPKRLNTLHIIVGIWIAMVLSVFCCSVAWSVEFRRLEESGMNIMQLVPQYCLLGLMEGIGRQGLDLFFEVQVSGVPLEKYGSELNEAMIGFGSFINASLVFCLGSWFSDTLEDSIQLDSYYKMLMILSFVNLCYYSWLVPIYYKNKKQTKDDPIQGAVELITIGTTSRVLTRTNQISRRRDRDQDI